MEAEEEENQVLLTTLGAFLAADKTKQNRCVFEYFCFGSVCFCFRHFTFWPNRTLDGLSKAREGEACWLLRLRLRLGLRDGGVGGDGWSSGWKQRGRRGGRRRRRWKVCALHCGAGGGAGEGVRGVSEAQLHSPAAADPGVPDSFQHWVKADQSLVSEPQVRGFGLGMVDQLCYFLEICCLLWFACTRTTASSQWFLYVLGIAWWFSMVLLSLPAFKFEFLMLKKSFWFGQAQKGRDEKEKEDEDNFIIFSMLFLSFWRHNSWKFACFQVRINLLESGLKLIRQQIGFQVLLSWFWGCNSEFCCWVERHISFY